MWLSKKYLVGVVGILAAITSPVRAQPNIQYATVSEPFLFLLREPAVQQDLKLSTSQRQSLLALNAKWDEALLALRTWPNDKAAPKVAEIQADSQRETDGVLNQGQRLRLKQIGLRVRGILSLQRDDVAEQLKLTDDQRQNMQRIHHEAQQKFAVLSEPQPADNGVSAEQERRRLQEMLQRDTLALLSEEQRKQLVALLGPKFDLSRLGRVSFQAPELIDAGGWINSKPLRIADLRGQVIVLHFWTYG